MPEKPISRIVSAVIICDGRVLLCLERVSGGRGHYWLEPGGKVEREEEELAAIRRELEEEIGWSSEVLKNYQIDLKPYCEHLILWFGKILHLKRFIAHVKEFPPVTLRAKQIEYGWFSIPPAGGLINESVETLFICLRLGGYLANNR